MIVMKVDDYQLSNFDKSLLISTIVNNPYIPVELYDKQLLSVALVNKDWSNVNEILTGGSGGGGKTTLLSALAVQFLQVPDYRCLVSRKNYKELVGTGSVFDILEDWVTPGNVFNCTINHSSPIRIGLLVVLKYILKRLMMSVVSKQLRVSLIIV